MTDRYHIYFDTPPAIFKARVNLPESADYPVSVIPFDGVTLGAFGDLIPDMTLILGTTDGGDDLGRVRVQNFATSDAIPIGRISQGVEDGTVDLQDNAYITVLDDYRVWSKIPFMILNDEVDIDTFKDSDIPVLSRNDEIPPVANCGPFVAGYIDPDTEVHTVEFPKDGVIVSYAVAEGAVITDYLWDVEDGNIVIGAATDPVITVEFPAGRRWVGLTVTDTNGKVQTSRTFVLSIDPDDDPTYRGAKSLTHQLTISGQKVDIELTEDLPRNTYMDGCLVLIWEGEAANPGDRNHMRFVGWHQEEDWNVSASKRGISRNTTIHCVDIAGRLQVLPGFSQALERNDEEQKWEYMPDLTMNRALNYLIGWHTTALSLADYIPPDNGDNYPTMRLDTTGGTLFEQANSTANKMVPKHHLTCTPLGELIYLEDWMEIDVADRPESTLELTVDDIKELRASYNRHPKVHVLSAGAVVTSTDWVIEDGEETLPLAFCKAPGDAFSQGTVEVVESEGLTLSQTDLNKAAGHRYARHNARFAPFDIIFANFLEIWSYAPAYLNRVQLSIPAAYAAQRGLDFTSAFGQPKSLDIRINEDKTGIKISASLKWEKETFGKPGTTHIPEETTDPDENVPDPGFPVEPVPIPGDTNLVAGIGLDGYIYRTFNFQNATPTWERVNTGIAATIYTWVVDPFSPGYLTGSGPINGWIVNDTDIYRVLDIFDTVVVTSVFTFPTATDAAEFHWRSIQASFGAFFEDDNPWLVCVSYYKDEAGHTGTWCVRSVDGGATWSSEVQITAHYYSGTVSRFRPIGVYTSPKTPGRIITTAYVSTAADALAQGYISTDYGATWSAYADVQSGNGMAGTIHVPWHDNSDEGIILHGLLTTAEVEGTPEELLPFFGRMNDDDGVDSYTAHGYDVSYTTEAHAVESGEPGIDEHGSAIIIAPPPDTKRMVVQGTYNAGRGRSNASQSAAVSLTINNASGTSRTDDLSFSSPPYGSPGSGSFEIEWTYSLYLTNDWPINSDTIQASPPTTLVGCRVRGFCNANASSGQSANSDISFTLTVTEIELDDGSIYTPVLGTAARSYKTMRVEGGVISDVSPVDVDRAYGVNRGHFALRAHDSNRQWVLVSVSGNDLTNDPDDDFHAVYISDDDMVSWTEVVAPVSDTSAPAGRAAFEAAFGAEDPNVLFILGIAEYIKYSDDGGATLQDKEGNLSSFSPSAWIGICGGPLG